MTAPIIAALPTPFDDALEIDETAFTELLAGLPADHRTVLVAGTTGEFPALTFIERVRLYRLAVAVLGADRVIAHVGAASPREALILTDAAREIGIERVALLTPYYLPADQQQVIDFFAEFASRQPDVRTYAYLFPERTGVTVQPATLKTIAQLPNLAGVKLSGSANDHFAAYRAALADDQELYTGADRQLLDIRDLGGTGVISGCFPVLPEPFLHGLDGSSDPEAAQAAIDHVVGLIGPSIARQKLALHHRTGHPWRSRMSMPKITSDLDREIRDLVDRTGPRIAAALPSV